MISTRLDKQTGSQSILKDRVKPMNQLQTLKQELQLTELSKYKDKSKLEN